MKAEIKQIWQRMGIVLLIFIAYVILLRGAFIFWNPLWVFGASWPNMAVVIAIVVFPGLLAILLWHWLACIPVWRWSGSALLLFLWGTLVFWYFWLMADVWVVEHTDLPDGVFIGVLDSILFVQRYFPLLPLAVVLLWSGVRLRRLWAKRADR